MVAAEKVKADFEIQFGDLRDALFFATEPCVDDVLRWRAPFATLSFKSLWQVQTAEANDIDSPLAVFHKIVLITLVGFEKPVRQVYLHQ